MKAAICSARRYPALIVMAAFLAFFLPMSASAAPLGGAFDPSEEYGETAGGSGKIVSAKLTKKSFTRSQARTVKLEVRFRPESEKFSHVIHIRKNGKWVKVKAVNRKGSYGGLRKFTVKSLFAGKAIKAGQYRLRLSADKNSRTLNFRVRAR